MSKETDMSSIWKWKNTGARFPLPDGRTVEKGDVFEASPISKTVQMRRGKLQPVSPDGEVTVGEAPDPGPEAVYPGLDFSDAAYELARDAGLTADDLADVEGSGADGSLLVGDIRAVLDG